MDLNAFVESRRASWLRLEELVRKLEEGGPTGLALHVRREAEAKKKTAETEKAEQAAKAVAEDVPAVVAARELGGLYRAACADLIRARSETANAELIGYLNGLVGRAYGVIYRGPRFQWVGFLRFVLVGFPRRVRAARGALLLAAIAFALGVAFGWIAETSDPTAKYYLLPREYALLEPKIQRSAAAQGGTSMPIGANAFQGAQIMTNNISVSFGAFAFGATAGVGTAAVLFYNGVLLGDLGAMFARHQMSEAFWALIVPHGVIEITAILIAGAAGFTIARALVAPGAQGRRQALAVRGREAIELVMGCALLLIPAGLIEGFITPQPSIPVAAKLGIGAFTGVFLLAYLVANEAILDRLDVLESLDGSHAPPAP